MLNEKRQPRAVAREMIELDLNFSLSGVRNTPFQQEADRERYFKALREPSLPECLPNCWRIFEIEFAYGFRPGS